MPSFSIPLSGLTASSTALSAISNNLANMNTVGYKDTRVTFRDLFYQNIGSTGSGDPQQIGTGASVGTLDTNFNAGNLETTGVSTDVAISGDGFFVLQGDGGNQYTRAGNFSVNSAGWLVSSDGLQVMGYPAVNGVINPTQTLGPLQLGKGQINPPNPTSYIETDSNLNAGAAVGDSFPTSLTVYDSLGTSHIVTTQFTKTAANTWSYQMTVPGSDVGSSSAITIDSGALNFDSNGVLTSRTDAMGNTISPLTNVQGIKIAGLADGASDMTFDWKLISNGQPTLTQVASQSSTASTYQDGFASGTLLNFSINSDGTIEGSFTNGTKALGQIAMANFSNAEGLSHAGNNNFSATLASGQPVIGTPGTSGRGTVSGGALEDSNVDISHEFSNLIMAQRGFEAKKRYADFTGAIRL